MRRLGLDYATLEKRFPGLIYCACYGYSEQGPYAGRAAIDDTIQAASGMAWLQGGAGAQAPRYVNSVIADKVVALYVANAVTSALLARARRRRPGGGGAHVRMHGGIPRGRAPGRPDLCATGGTGYARLLNEYRRPFRTRDGYMSVVPYDAAMATLFTLSGHPEMAQDPRYLTLNSRSRHFPELYRYVETVLAERSTAQWTELLATADIPYAPVNDFEALLTDPHLRATGFWHESEHPTEGQLVQAGLPIRFSRTPGEIRRHPPGLGEHTAEVLAEAGATDQRPRRRD